MQERRYVRLFLVLASLVVFYFFFRIFQPFLIPVSLAAILATLTYPVFDWTVSRLKGKRALAALLTCLGVTASIIVPFLLLLFALAGEVTQVYQQLQAKIQSGELQEFLDLRENVYTRRVLDRVAPYLRWEELDLMGSITGTLRQVSVFFLRYSTSILSGLVQTLTNFLVMLVTMFFIFRDGTRLAEELRTWTPLSESYEEQIMEKFRRVASATVLGSLLTALAQGAAGGLVYWLLGIPNPLFWAFVTALFSLVPVVGTAIVWVPWTLYFGATGSYLRAAILVILAVLFVGMIDNVVRPVFIEGRAKMHTLLVFFSIMGGIAYLGMVGMIFGPIIVAVGLTFLELYKLEFQQELSKPAE